MKLSVKQCSWPSAHWHIDQNYTNIARKHRISDDLRPNCQLGSNARKLLGIFNRQRHQLCIYNEHLYLLHFRSRNKTTQTILRYHIAINLHILQQVASILPNSQNTVSQKRPSEVSVNTADEMSSTAQVTNSDKVEDAIDTEFLIVGAGPAGAALACFLGSHGKYLGRSNSRSCR